MNNASASRRSLFRQIVLRELEERRTRRPSYSMRAFASFLGISAAALSQLISEKGEWELSPERASVLLDKLKVNDKQKRRLLVALGREDEIAQVPLGPEQFRVLSDWRYSAVLLCHDLEVSLRSPEALAKRLKLSTEVVTTIIAELHAIGLLKKTATDDYFRVPFFLSFFPDRANDAVKHYHKNGLEVANRALDEVPFSSRDFNLVTFAGTRANFAAIKSEIAKFTKRVTAIAESENQDNDEVYQLFVSCFPLDFSQELM